MQLKPINQQVVAVVGASSGIGRETAIQLAARGAKLVVSARSEPGLDSLVDEIRQIGGEAIAIPADVTNFEQVKAIADKAIEQYGRLDTWVHSGRRREIDFRVSSDAGYQPTLRLYEQMPEPKYVIAMGACMITGGMFSADSYTAIRGADKILPIDVYIPGCPPRPEAIMDAIIKLRKKISNESIQERGRIQRTHRYYSTTHNMKLVPPTAVTGKDATLPSRQQPPKELAEAMGMPLPPALQSSQKQEVSKE